MRPPAGCGPEGYVAVGRALLSDQGPPALPATASTMGLLGDDPIDSPSSLAERYGRAVAESLEALGDGSLPDRPDAEARAGLLAWLVERGLLDLEGSDADRLGAAQVLPGDRGPAPRAPALAGDGRGDARGRAGLPPRQPEDRRAGRAPPDAPGPHGRPRFAGPGGRQRAAGARPADRRPGQPADGARRGEPRLAPPLRPGARPFRRQLRRTRRSALPPGAARRPRRTVRPGRLVDQTAGPRAGPQQHVRDGQHRHSPEAEAADPDNRLLHRMPVRRLEAEAIRDAILAVSGRLDEKMGGPGVEVHLTPFMDNNYTDDYGRPKASGPLDGDGRRSLYLKVRRNFPTPMLVAFDMPPPLATAGRRDDVERAGAGADPDERPVRRPAGAVLGPARAGHRGARRDRPGRADVPGGLCPAADGGRAASGPALPRTSRRRAGGPGRTAGRRTSGSGRISPTSSSTSRNSSS